MPAALCWWALNVILKIIMMMMMMTMMINYNNNSKIRLVDQDPCILSGGHYLAIPGDRTGQVNWKTHHQYHWLYKRDGVSVSVTVRGNSRGKRSFFSTYLYCQLVGCNPLFSLLLNVCVRAWLFAR